MHGASALTGSAVRNLVFGRVYMSAFGTFGNKCRTISTYIRAQNIGRTHCRRERDGEGPKKGRKAVSVFNEKFG
jgi:hypothetical protein